MARQYDIQYIRYYTDGSAARKVALAAPLKTLKLPRIKKQKKAVVRVDPIALAGIVMSVVMFVLMCVGISQLRTAQQELQAMTVYVDTLQTENASLETTFQQSYDIDQIEKTALALGLVPEEQVKHVTIQAMPTQTEEEPDAWERFYIFLTGLFA